MPVYIQQDQELHDIQEAFQEKYPQFKMEFSFGGSTPDHWGKITGRPFPYIKVAEVASDMRKLPLTIKDEMTVREVEELFWHQLGIPIQVYIKNNNYWMKNAYYDSYPLDAEWASVK